jgi:hypothetical protein
MTFEEAIELANNKKEENNDLFYYWDGFMTGLVSYNLKLYDKFPITHQKWISFIDNKKAEVRDRGYGYIDGFMFLNDSPNFSNEARIKKESEQKRDKEHPEFIKEFETIRRQKNEI